MDCSHVHISYTYINLKINTNPKYDCSVSPIVCMLSLPPYDQDVDVLGLRLLSNDVCYAPVKA
jgi:hypothetical protein